MTIANGDTVEASDILAINTIATSAQAAAATALANSTTALANAVSAEATAANALSVAGNALVISGLPLATSVSPSNLVPVSQGGTNAAVTLTTFNAETIDLLGAATAAADTDTFMVGQGSNVLVRQTMAAIWTYLQGKIPGYKVPVREIVSSTTLDATCNGQILVVTGASVTLTPNYLLMGPGFECEIVTAGSGTVIWGPGITATNGGTGLSSANAYARLIALTSSAGTVVLAFAGMCRIDRSVTTYQSNASGQPDNSYLNTKPAVPGDVRGALYPGPGDQPVHRSGQNPGEPWHAHRPRLTGHHAQRDARRGDRGL